MDGQTLTWLYPVVLLGAAISDILWLRIPNWLSVLLVACFVAYALIAGFGVDFVAWRLGLGLGILLLGFVVYNFGLLGGGDVKLIAASAVWVGPNELAMFLLLIALFGGVLAASVFILRKSILPIPGWLVRQQWFSRLITDGKGIPYGVAICAGGIFTFHEALTALPKV